MSGHAERYNETRSNKALSRREFIAQAGLYGLAGFFGGRLLGLRLKRDQFKDSHLDSQLSENSSLNYQPAQNLRSSYQPEPLTEEQKRAISRVDSVSSPSIEEQNRRLDTHALYDLAQNSGAVEKIRQGKTEGLLELYSNLIEAAAKRYDLDPKLHRALIFFESGFHPSIISSSYATGLGQIMHLHGKNLDFTDPQTNILKSAEILRQYHGERADFDDPSMIQIIEGWRQTLMDYNGGPYRAFTSDDTEQYAQNIITLFNNFNNKKILEFVKKGHGVWSTLYWNLMPTNPLAGEIKRVGADFGQEADQQSTDHQPKGHKGWDFEAGEGTPIYPTAPGKIAFADWLSGEPNTDRGLGLTIVLEHDTSVVHHLREMEPVYTIYSHMSQFSRRIELGRFVSPANPIGYVGATGNATSSQLHYSVYFKGGVNREARQMVGGEWKHPLWLLPPKQQYPGDKRLKL